MLRNYLKTAWRSVRRRPYLSALNVFGLAVGLTAALLIGLYVGHERSFDRFHEHADRLYRVVFEEEDSQFENAAPVVLADQLVAAFPDVAEAVAFSGGSKELLMEAGGKRFYEEDFAKTGPAFFDLFSFEVVHGNLATALDDPGSIVLTRPKARKYFGDDNPIGRAITVFDESRIDLQQYREEGSFGFETVDEATYTVTAVVEAPPSTSTIQFGLLRRRRTGTLREWNIRGARVYALLDENARLEAMHERLPAFVKQYGGSAADGIALHLQPLVEAHLRPQMGTSEKLGPVAYLWIFAAAALLILLIACVNYANLATARAAERAKEVGIRKTVGAGRGMLAMQFLGEAVLTTLAALLLALGAARLLLPVFSGVVDADLSFRHLPGGWWTPAGVALGVGLLSGLYPAVVLSGFRPAQVLKGARGGGQRAAGLRRGLVVFQFAASVGLVLATVVIQRQMQYVRAERLNTGEDEIVVLPLKGDALEGGAYDAFKQRLEARPEVARVTTGRPPGTGTGFRLGNDIDTTDAFEYFDLMFVGDDFAETFGLEMVAGRSFENAPVDHLDSANVSLINETAARMVDGEAVIGQDDSPFNNTTVVGIVKNFHTRSLYERIGPVAIVHNSDARSNAMVRLKEGQVSSGLDAVRSAWNDLGPERPLNFHFLDDTLDEQYRTERRLGRIFGAFGLVAVLVAGLGLFGLAAHTAQARSKEIAIRKTFGASTRQVVQLLSADFLKLVALGFAVAAPLAWWAMQRWLEDFAYRTDLGAGLFLLTGAAALLVALAAVGSQALRAARANPADALRDE